MSLSFEDKVNAAYLGMDVLAGGTDGLDEEAMLEAAKRWIKNHSGRSVEKSPFDSGEIRQAWLGQDKECAYCTNDLVDPRNNNLVPYAERCTGDHFEPEILGGLTIPGNCVACHQSCNSKKGTLNPVALSKRLNQPLTTI